MTNPELPFENTSADNIEHTESEQRIHDKISDTRSKLQEIRDNKEAESEIVVDEAPRTPTVDEEVRGFGLSRAEVRRRQHLEEVRKNRQMLEETPRWEPAPMENPVAEYNPPPATPQFKPGTDQPPEEEQTI